MASPWAWDRVCLLVALCLSIVSGECPDNNLLKVAVDDIILEADGIAVAQYPVGSILNLSCLWLLSAPCSNSRPPPSPVVTVDGVAKIPSEPVCVTVVDRHTGARKSWHSSSISYTMENGRINYVCKFNGCNGESLLLSITSGSEIQHPRDGGYCLSSDEDCYADSTPSASDTPTASHTTTPSTSSSAPAITSRTTAHTTAASAIPGLNPLIYTLLAVILLGTASIVAMVTCWMRHRRLMRRRREALFGREYLDFMGEQDFTTVTTNQLLASLAEAPPTYQQSEVIEQRMREGGEDTEETPPPLPPRNTTTERRQVAPEPPLNVTGAVEANSEEEGGDKEDGSVEPILSDHSEEEESYYAKDDDSTALIH